MKHIIVSYHPYDKSFNAAIVQKLIETINRKEGHSIEHIDLARNNFNPVMTSNELFEFAQARTNRGVVLENLDPQAVQFADMINSCDHMILVFPIWWELMPAQMKGFIDKVIFPGLFYKYKSEFTFQALSEKLKNVSVITTMNTPGFLYSLQYHNCIKQSLIKGTFKKLGIKNVKWNNLGFIKKISDAKREKILNSISLKLSAAI